ncbi:hypothetical protein ACFL5O_05885, partial [Myxococcota bacterium]
MHLVRIAIEGLSLRSPLVLDLGTRGALRKWTVLAAGPTATNTLVAIAASLAPGQIAHLLEPHLRVRWARRDKTLRTEFTYVRDGRDDGAHGTWVGGAELTDGGWVGLKPGQLRTAEARTGSFGTSLRRAAPLGNLVLAYGPTPEAAVRDAFDFSDADYPFGRVKSLLDHDACLTDSIRFLERINAKAYECGTARQKQLLARLGRALSRALGLVDDNRSLADCPGELLLADWTARAFPYAQAWRQLREWQTSVLSVVVDAARHANDAFPRCPCPLDQSGILLLERPDRLCSVSRLPHFAAAFDELFPRLQFILTLGSLARAHFPRGLVRRRLVPLLEQATWSPPYRTVRVPPRSGHIPPGSVLLVQVDGTLPNFALMQLSSHLKSQGHRVGLSRRPGHALNPASVYASAIFTSEHSKRCLEKLQECYGDRLIVGGSGVDLDRRLGPSVEAQPPDYSLYPSLGDRAIGFLTRGCPGRCAFCLVPRKEGSVRQVADLEMLLQGRRKKLILLDDNLLAYPRATELLEQMVRHDLSVNFNQTLDLRRLQPDQAELLRRIRCSNLAFHRRVYHFSLNDDRGLARLRRCYELLRVASEDNAEFVCMYGYDSSLAEDLERLRFLRSLPRAYVCLQRYRPVPGGPPAELSRLFDEHSEEHLDELVRVVFPQNMKNVERYYRWLCLEYARQCGRIHLGLVDTLFRYNHRHLRGVFLQQLREIARLARAATRTSPKCQSPAPCYPRTQTSRVKRDHARMR